MWTAKRLTFLLLLLFFSREVYCYYEEQQRLDKINSFEAVGGRDAYRQRRIESLMNLKRHVKYINPKFREDELYKINKMIEEVDYELNEELQLEAEE